MFTFKTEKAAFNEVFDSELLKDSYLVIRNIHHPNYGIENEILTSKLNRSLNHYNLNTRTTNDPEGINLYYKYKLVEFQDEKDLKQNEKLLNEKWKELFKEELFESLKNINDYKFIIPTEKFNENIQTYNLDDNSTLFLNKLLNIPNIDLMKQLNFDNICININTNENSFGYNAKIEFNIPVKENSMIKSFLHISTIIIVIPSSVDFIIYSVIEGLKKYK
jgi:hypothetical protein